MANFDASDFTGISFDSEFESLLNSPVVHSTGYSGLSINQSSSQQSFEAQGIRSLQCQGCVQYKADLNRMDQEHRVNFQFLKKKVMHTDLLIRKLKTKQDECVLQSSEIQDLRRRLEQVTRDSEILSQQLNTAIEKVKPLQKEKEQLESELRAKSLRITELSDMIEGERALRCQRSALDDRNLHLENEVTLLKKQNNSLTTKNQSLDFRLKDLQSEKKGLESNKSITEKRLENFAVALNEAQDLCASFWTRLKQNGLITDEKKPNLIPNGYKALVRKILSKKSASHTGSANETVEHISSDDDISANSGSENEDISDLESISDEDQSHSQGVEFTSQSPSKSTQDDKSTSKTSLPSRQQELVSKEQELVSREQELSKKSPESITKASQENRPRKIVGSQQGSPRKLGESENKTSLYSETKAPLQATGKAVHHKLPETAEKIFQGNKAPADSHPSWPPKVENVKGKTSASEEMKVSKTSPEASNMASLSKKEDKNNEIEGSKSEVKDGSRSLQVNKKDSAKKRPEKKPFSTDYDLDSSLSSLSSLSSSSSSDEDSDGNAGDDNLVGSKNGKICSQEAEKSLDFDTIFSFAYIPKLLSPLSKSPESVLSKISLESDPGVSRDACDYLDNISTRCDETLLPELSGKSSTQERNSHSKELGASPGSHVGSAQPHQTSSSAKLPRSSKSLLCQASSPGFLPGGYVNSTLSSDSEDSDERPGTPDFCFGEAHSKAESAEAKHEVCREVLNTGDSLNSVTVSSRNMPGEGTPSFSRGDVAASAEDRFDENVSSPASVKNISVLSDQNASNSYGTVHAEVTTTEFQSLCKTEKMVEISESDLKGEELSISEIAGGDEHSLLRDRNSRTISQNESLGFSPEHVYSSDDDSETGMKSSEKVPDVQIQANEISQVHSSSDIPDVHISSLNVEKCSENITHVQTPLENLSKSRSTSETLSLSQISLETVPENLTDLTEKFSHTENSPEMLSNTETSLKMSSRSEISPKTLSSTEDSPETSSAGIASGTLSCALETLSNSKAPPVSTNQTPPEAKICILSETLCSTQSSSKMLTAKQASPESFSQTQHRSASTSQISVEVLSKVESLSEALPQAQTPTVTSSADQTASENLFCTKTCTDHAQSECGSDNVPLAASSEPSASHGALDCSEHSAYVDSVLGDLSDLSSSSSDEDADDHANNSDLVDGGIRLNRGKGPERQGSHPVSPKRVVRRMYLSDSESDLSDAGSPENEGRSVSESRDRDESTLGKFGTESCEGPVSEVASQKVAKQVGLISVLSGPEMSESDVDECQDVGDKQGSENIAVKPETKFMKETAAEKTTKGTELCELDLELSDSRPSENDSGRMNICDSDRDRTSMDRVSETVSLKLEAKCNESPLKEAASKKVAVETDLGGLEQLESGCFDKCCGASERGGVGGKSSLKDRAKCGENSVKEVAAKKVTKEISLSDSDTDKSDTEPLISILYHPSKCKTNPDRGSENTSVASGTKYKTSLKETDLKASAKEASISDTDSDLSDIESSESDSGLPTVASWQQPGASIRGRTGRRVRANAGVVKRERRTSIVETVKHTKDTTAQHQSQIRTRSMDKKSDVKVEEAVTLQAKARTPKSESKNESEMKSLSSESVQTRRTNKRNLDDVSPCHTPNKRKRGDSSRRSSASPEAADVEQHEGRDKARLRSRPKFGGDKTSRASKGRCRDSIDRGSTQKVDDGSNVSGNSHSLFKKSQDLSEGLNIRRRTRSGSRLSESSVLSEGESTESPGRHKFVKGMITTNTVTNVDFVHSSESVKDSINKLESVKDSINNSECVKDLVNKLESVKGSSSENVKDSTNKLESVKDTMNKSENISDSVYSFENLGDLFPMSERVKDSQLTFGNERDARDSLKDAHSSENVNNLTFTASDVSANLMPDDTISAVHVYIYSVNKPVCASGTMKNAVHSSNIVKDLPSPESVNHSIPTPDSVVSSVSSLEIAKDSFAGHQHVNDCITVPVSINASTPVPENVMDFTVISKNVRDPVTTDSVKNSIPAFMQAENVVHSPESAKDTVLVSENVKDTVLASGNVKDSVLASYNVKDTVLVSGNVKDSVLASDNVKDSVLASDNVKDTVLVSENLKDTVLVSDNVKNTVLVSDNVKDTVLAPENVKDTVLTPENVKDTVLVSDNVKVTVLVSDNVKNTVLVSENVKDTVLAPENVKDTVLAPENVKDTVLAPENVKDTVLVSENVKDTVLVSDNVKDTVLVSENLKDTVLVSYNVKDTVLVSENVRDAVLVSDNMKDTVLVSDNVKDTVLVSDNVKDTVLVSDNVKDTVLAPENVKDTVLAPENVKDTVLASDNVKDTVIVSDNVKDTVLVSDNLKDTVLVSYNVKDTVLVSENVKDTVLVSDNVKDTVLAPENVKDTVLVSDNVKDTVLAPENVKDTVLVPENVKDTVLVPENVKDTVLVSENVKDTVLVSENVKDTVLVSENVTDTVLASENMMDTVLVSGKMKDAVCTSATVNSVINTQGNIVDLVHISGNKNTSQGVEDSLHTSANVTKTMETPGNDSVHTLGNDSVHTLENVNKTMTTLESVKYSVHILENVNKTVNTLESVKDSVRILENVNKTVNARESVTDSVHTLENLKNASGSTKDSVHTLENVNKTMNIPKSTKDSLNASGNVDDAINKPQVVQDSPHVPKYTKDKCRPDKPSIRIEKDSAISQSGRHDSPGLSKRRISRVVTAQISLETGNQKHAKNTRQETNCGSRMPNAVVCPPSLSDVFSFFNVPRLLSPLPPSPTASEEKKLLSLARFDSGTSLNRSKVTPRARPESRSSVRKAESLSAQIIEARKLLAKRKSSFQMQHAARPVQVGQKRAADSSDALQAQASKRKKLASFSGFPSAFAAVMYDLKQYLAASEVNVKVTVETMLTRCEGENIKLAWDLLCQVIVKHLESKSEDVLSHLVSACRKEGIVNNVYVTQDEKQMVQLVNAFLRLDKSLDQRCLMSQIWTAIFSRDCSSDLSRQSLCRMFTSLCMEQGDLEQARILVYSIAWCDHLDLASPLMAIVGVWPDVLGHSFVLSKSCMCQVLNFILREKYSSDASMFQRVCLVLQRVCQWDLEKASHSAEELLKTLIEKFLHAVGNVISGTETDRSFEFMKAIELLLVHKGSVWTEEHFMRRTLSSYAMKWENSWGVKKGPPPQFMVYLIRILRAVMAVQLVSSSAAGNVVKMVFVRLLKINSSDKSVEAAVVDALLELAPQHPGQCLELVKKWQASNQGNISPETLRKIQHTLSVVSLEPRPPPKKKKYSRCSKRSL